MNKSDVPPFANPFRPGAGHQPPYLAGRRYEESEFRRLLDQSIITENTILTGLRGVGKTVLLESFKPIAIQEGWLWVGTDLSESVSISEVHIATRLLTDLSLVTRNILVGHTAHNSPGFASETTMEPITLGFEHLHAVYSQTPGLIADKLKAVFIYVAPFIAEAGRKGVIFAYDEAQNMSDHAANKEYPLSLLLDVFQSIQRQGITFMMLLVGLPTLFPKLVAARTYTERMFRVLFLKQLTRDESRDAVTKPISSSKCPVTFQEPAVNLIIKYSGGYPYFIQFMCREAYDAWLQKTALGQAPSVPVNEIIRKLDNDFFAGRWARVTDRQQQLLFVIAQLDAANDEFTIQDILSKSDQVLKKSFSRSQINQMLATLINAGLIYKDRHGKYLFAVPLMADFIKRTMEDRLRFEDHHLC
jgi:hypothetical protein